MKKCVNCDAPVLENVPFCPHCGTKQSAPLSDSDRRRDPYNILQVSRDAEPEVVEAAYKSLARKYHPDVSSDPNGKAKMQEINWAHDILISPIKTKDWNSQGTPQRERPSTQHATSEAPSYSQPQGPPKETTDRKQRSRSSSSPLVWIGVALFFLFLCGVLLSTGGQGSISTPTPSTTPSPTETPNPTAAPTSTSTSTSLPPTNTPHTVENPLRAQGCIKWSEVRYSHVGSELCIFGIVVSAKSTSHPYTIQFSDDWNEFKVQDWNYYYPGVTPGMCIIVTGQVVDNVDFLMLLPTKDKDAVQSYSRLSDCR